MADTGGVHREHRQGVATLTCNGEAFARVAAAVAAAAGPAAGDLAGADLIVVRRATPPSPPPNRWLDAAGYLGCAALAAAVIALLGAGAYTVSRWAAGP